MQTWRFIYAVLAWLNLAVLVVQVFLAGVGLFGAGDFELHRNVGYWLPIIALLMLPIAWPARIGRRLVLLTLAVFVLSFVQGILPALRGSVPLIAALHPVNALLLFWLSLVIARAALDLTRTTTETETVGQDAATQQA
jgi:Family of unknown function (DUF6220)